MKMTKAALRIAVGFSVILFAFYFFPTEGFAELTNISTRGFVGTGDNVLISGFIINGTSPIEVLVRGRGPSLSGAPFFLRGTLSNPFLQIFSGQSLIAQNDSWQNVQQTEIRATGLDPCEANPGQSTAPPGCNQESAILVTLTPGAYTAILSGVGGATGVGLIEVFGLTGTTASPSILGTFSGSITFTQANCQNPGINGTFGSFATLNITQQNGSFFSGTGSFANGTVTMNVTGTVTVGGALGGSFITIGVPSLPSGGFDSSGQSTGSVAGNTLTITFFGQGTVDVKCIVSGVLSVTRRLSRVPANQS